MYTKLFQKILDSSIWLENNTTRITWITLLAAMDEDGVCRFASVANLAHRAILSLADAEAAVKVLESPDPNSADPSNEGRRIERIEGGWIVLNAKKYQQIAKKIHLREQTRERVSRFRQKKREQSSNADVTHVYEYENENDSKNGSKEEELSNEDVVTSIGLEHPRNAHLKAHHKSLPCNQQQAIAEACMEDGIDIVRAGTLNYRDAVSKWPEHERQFATNPVEFYGPNKHYLKDPKEWERPAKGNGKSEQQIHDDIAEVLQRRRARRLASAENGQDEGDVSLCQSPASGD